MCYNFGMKEDYFYNYIRYLRIGGFSKRTIESYLYYNRNFLTLTSKSPRDVHQSDIVK